jgi:predicted ATPase
MIRTIERHAALALLKQAVGETGGDMSSERLARARGEIGVRLPPITSSFVGRDADVATGQSLLRRNDVRLLTLTGPGGVGKTRLAIEIARAAISDFPDGVVFVPLAAVRDPALVLPTIAKRLELPDHTTETLLSGLSLFLRSRSTVLLLDNFEQVITAAGNVERLLDACPQLKLIVTSRVPLRIDGEDQFAVSPLPVPEPGQTDAETLDQLAAVKLFIARAQIAQPARSLTDDERATIAEICRQVDGLPLAIELAAARSRSIPLAALTERLEDRLASLVREGHEGPIRQLTMRDTIAWSYDLLNTEEQALFRRLSVFIGGFTQESAEAVCHDLGCFAAGCIGSLIDQNLVRRVSRPGVPERLRLLETIREFAAEYLAAAGETESAGHWHATYFGNLASEAEPHLIGSEQVTWFDTLEREHDNLRAALEWSLKHGNVDIALQIGSGLWRFWERRGHVGEGRMQLENIMRLAGEPEPTADYAGALFGTGRLHYIQGDFDSARKAFRRLVNISSERKFSDKHSGALTQLAHLATREGDYLAARTLAEEGLAIRRRTGDHWGAAVSLLVLGRNAFDLGDHTRATKLTEEGIAIFKQFGDRQGMADGYEHLGTYELRRGRFALARGHTEQALSLRQELGDDMAVAESMALLGMIAIGQGNYTGARLLFIRSLTRLADLGARWRIDPALTGIAEVALATGEPERAVRIMAAADRIRTDLGSYLVPDALDRNQRNIAAARDALGAERFDTEWSAGRDMTVDQISRHNSRLGRRVTASPDHRTRMVHFHVGPG